MSIRCRILGHRAPRIKKWNEGLWFGSCPDCESTVISSGSGRWHSLPSKTRVVWKPAGEHCMDWWMALPRRRTRWWGA